MQSMRRAAAHEGAHAIVSLNFAQHAGVPGDARAWREIGGPTPPSPLRVAMLPALAELDRTGD
jgi:hypothetical protein